MIRCSLNSYHFPGKTVGATYHASAEEPFPNIQSELALTSFHFLGSCPWSPDRWDHHLPLSCSPQGSCRLWWGHPSALFSVGWTSPVTWAALLIHFSFKIFHHLGCPPLDMLQQCDVLILWLPELHTILKVRLYQHRAERGNHPLMGWWCCAWCFPGHGWPLAARAADSHSICQQPKPSYQDYQSRLKSKAHLNFLAAPLTAGIFAVVLC